MKSKAIGFIKAKLRPVRNHLRQVHVNRKLVALIKSRGGEVVESFDFDEFCQRTERFVSSMRMDAGGCLYKYSASCTKPTLYASAYAAMTLSLLGSLDALTDPERNEWREYFDSFQCANDGLFYDPAVQNEIYNEADWWGARHLALHMISAYTDLGFRPKYPFYFLKKYYGRVGVENWLDQFDWESASIGVGDIDNKIMNIGCLLQYQRDTWRDADAANAVEVLKGNLKRRLSLSTGMWGGFDLENPEQRSRAVQFAYHLLPIFFYDNDFDFDVEKIVSVTLRTRNKYGGYGVAVNSSACEDIDSIDILARFYPYCSADLRAQIDYSIKLSFGWVLLNQVGDGGFVFRLNEPFVYGSKETSSGLNVGAMMPTWFRTLSLAYVSRHLNLNHCFKLTDCPGYEFK